MVNPVPAPALAADVAVVDPATQGRWHVLPFQFGSEVLAVHAVLLNNGKVLFAAGSGNSAFRFGNKNFGNTALKNWTSVVWDPTVSPPPGRDTNFFHPDTTLDAQGKVLDFFCGGGTTPAPGRWLPPVGTASCSKKIVAPHVTPLFGPGAPHCGAARYQG